MRKRYLYFYPLIAYFVVKTKRRVDSLTRDDTAVGVDIKRVQTETADDGENSTGSSEKPLGSGTHSGSRESCVESGLSGFSDLFFFHKD